MKFSQDTHGYIEAKKWLYKHGLLHCLTDGFSVDGFSVVACANEEWERMHSEEISGTEIYELLIKTVKDEETKELVEKLHNKYLLLLGIAENFREVIEE